MREWFEKGRNGCGERGMSIVRNKDKIKKKKDVVKNNGGTD